MTEIRKGSFVHEGGPVNARKDAVGKGWGPLLDEMHEELAALDPDYSTAQVKEKFGTLTVYLSSYMEGSGDILGKYARKSSTVCEACGESGTFRADGWCRTLCDPCEALRQALRNE